MARLLACLTCLLVLLVAPSAQAATGKSCEEPAGGDWAEATPAEAGMDAGRLRDAISYAEQNNSFAVRVYRRGCRVGEDSLADANRTTQYESWSMAKSATALVFGRAMALGLIGPDDPLGSLIPEADQPHGAITMRDLLTMTSGLRWNGFRDYNIFMPDRLREALTVEVEKPPGTYWEYSQSGPALLAEAVARASGEDFQAFAQRELFGPLGIEAGAWYWRRDSDGHTQGFFGLNMQADDFARLGELMRRRGVWRGNRLLTRRFVREAIEPVPQSGCYGWLIWLNASKPCVGPRIQTRPVDQNRMYPSLPADLYQYSGLFGQRVTVLPGQEIVIVRTGNDGGGFAGGAGWEEEFYRRVLASIADEEVRYPPGSPDAGEVSEEDVDRGFGQALADPDAYSGGQSPPPLPPAGLSRARAALIDFRVRRPTADGKLKAFFTCPPRWPAALRPRCAGKARVIGAGRPLRYRIRAGKAEKLRLPLSQRTLRRLERKRKLELTIRARNRDRLRGAVAKRTLTIRSRRTAGR